MVQYETLILAIPEVTNDESKQLEKQFDALIQKNKGSKISFERWGKYRLAQPVNKNNYGVYFLARFEINQDQKLSMLDEITEYLKIKAAAVVMRFMTSVIDHNKGLEYIKPAPLDETTRDVEKFLKDNKMESFVSSGNKEVKAAEAEEDFQSEEELSE